MALFTSLHGKRLGLGKLGNLFAKGGSLPLTVPAVDAVITVGAKVSNVRNISVQLKDANGNNCPGVQAFDIIMLLNAAGSDYAATGGSTGVAQGANGKVLAEVAKKIFSAMTDSTGLLAITYTDTGSEAVFLGVRLPNGRIVISSALA